MKKIFLCISVFIFIISLTNCVKADQLQMDNEWDTELFTSDIEMDSERNIYYVGAENGVEIKKYDENRNLVYSKKLTDYHSCSSVSIDREKNAYIICATDNSFFMDSEHNINREHYENIIIHTNLIKLDQNGNKVFDIELSTGNDFALFTGIKVYDNYLYAIGYRYLYKEFVRSEGTYNYYNYEAKSFLVKINLEGQIISETILGERSQQIEQCFCNDFDYGGGGGIRLRSFKRYYYII